MAEFCNKCAEDIDFPVDIDVYKIFEELEDGEMKAPYLCETCGLQAVANIGGNLKVIYIDSNKGWEDYKK